MKPSFAHLERYRFQDVPQLRSTPGAHRGCFWIRTGRDVIRIIASDGINPDDPFDALSGWEHVSVSVATPKGLRVPTWAEMCAVKDLFWNEDECVVQYHPPRAEYVNHHPCTLHLWRHNSRDFLRPPTVLV